MIIRYLRQGGTHGTSVSTFFQSNTLTGSTSRTETYSTVTQGAPGATITYKVTTLSHSNPGYTYQVDGVSYALGSTFTKVLDGTGHVTMTQFIDVGTLTSGNAIDVILTIFATSNGAITSPSTTNISKTT